MTQQYNVRAGWPLALCVLMVATSGCGGYFRRAHDLYQKPSPPRTLGSLQNPIFSNQESNADALKFIIYQHEFRYNSTKLNDAGQDHLKQVASRILNGQDMLVMVERSRSNIDPNSEYKFPVHLDPELDNQRRDFIVRALTALGVQDAEDRVVVAPSLRPHQTAQEASSAYQQGFSSGFGGGGGGGFGGGGFGGGGFGGGGIF